MGQMIEIKVNGTTTPGYLATPDGGQGPGVVVIQEWWGLVPHIKNIADRFAQAGYVALAPDLYHGQGTKSPDEAGKLMMALRIDEAGKDMQGAIDFLLSSDAVTSKKVGIVGFCMGGVLALYAATRSTRVGACVVYYGIHPNVHPDLPNLQAPVLGFYAERDGMVTPAVARDLQQKLIDLGKKADFTIYPGTDHAFFNDERPEVFNKAAADDTWKRMLDLFRTELVHK